MLHRCRRFAAAFHRYKQMPFFYEIHTVSTQSLDLKSEVHLHGHEKWMKSAKSGQPKLESAHQGIIELLIGLFKHSGFSSRSVYASADHLLATEYFVPFEQCLGKAASFGCVASALAYVQQWQNYLCYSILPDTMLCRLWTCTI